MNERSTVYIAQPGGVQNGEPANTLSLLDIFLIPALARQLHFIIGKKDGRWGKYKQGGDVSEDITNYHSVSFIPDRYFSLFWAWPYVPIYGDAGKY